MNGYLENVTRLQEELMGALKRGESTIAFETAGAGLGRCSMKSATGVRATGFTKSSTTATG